MASLLVEWGRRVAPPACPLARSWGGGRDAELAVMVKRIHLGFHVAGEFTISFICLVKAQRILRMASDMLQTSISPDFLISLK